MKIVIVSVFLFGNFCCYSQITKDHFLNFYYGMGVAKPVGSFSKQNNVYNQFGKCGPGFNLKAGMEFFIDGKNVVSMDYDFSFLQASNDSIDKIVVRSVASYSLPYIEAGSNGIDVFVNQVNFGYARVFNVGKLTIMPKINIGGASFGYDYTSAYLFTSTSSFTNVTNGGNLSTVDYSFQDYHYYTIKPELGIKYIIKRHEVCDWIFGFNVGYLYLHPKMPLYKNAGTSTEIARFNDKIHIITINVSIQLALKWSLFKKLTPASKKETGS